MNQKKKSSFSPFALFLGLVMLLFCGILVFAYYESKLANPIMLDETGHVKDSH
ncbi:MAG TPA: hypothetical protein VMT15_14110 [Bryobacteraceae bacterium]|nr:hypothetical protein [Bryobacteraceae bacterium]